MKYIKQVLLILCFSLVGEVLSHWIPLPIPAAIYGFVLLFFSLCAGVVKPEHFQETAQFLISVIGVFFVAPAVNLLACYHVIAPALVPILTIVISSTFRVFAVSGLVTQWLRRKGDGHD